MIEFIVFVIFRLQRISWANDEISIFRNGGADNIDEPLPVKNEVVVGCGAEQSIVEVHRDFEGDPAVTACK